MCDTHLLSFLREKFQDNLNPGLNQGEKKKFGNV